ncbi:helix-turn-helix domain-containing protein [Solirubrum puertoriconensis]|uniref:Helix-turn-helix domain-containing protein n=1 Tax=Solirubrum puertoriconensis TaxID=1751427 RepID=A0A9X0HNN4_SOLP1|nr:hypothetical protein ASU33_16825 [Solirubrum puertoriconensis]
MGAKGTMHTTIITAGITLAELMEQVRAVVRYELQQAGTSAPAPTAETEELLTVNQAAALLDVSARCVHSWKRKGLLPYHKIGGRSFIKRLELLNSLQSQQRSQKGGRRRG